MHACLRSADGTDPASSEPCALPPASATTAADRKQATLSQASVILREKGGRRHWHVASNSSFVSYVDADGRPHQVRSTEPALLARSAL